MMSLLMELKMSRGMPSMTALLGMLAIAGYKITTVELLKEQWGKEAHS